jgi:hypothetical protein
MERSEKGQFLPGLSGNPGGRPRGSRRKLGESFLNTLYEHWTQHGANAIARLCQEKPDIYVKLVVSLLPDKFDIPEVDPMEGVNMEELDAIIAYCRNQLKLTAEERAQAPHLIAMSLNKTC